MKDLLLWNKISRIVMLLAECLDISPVRALDIFYNRENCQFLYNSSFGIGIKAHKPYLKNNNGPLNLKHIDEEVHILSVIYYGLISRILHGTFFFIS